MRWVWSVLAQTLIALNGVAGACRSGKWLSRSGLATCDSARSLGMYKGPFCPQADSKHAAKPTAQTARRALLDAGAWAFLRSPAAWGRMFIMLVGGFEKKKRLAKALACCASRVHSLEVLQKSNCTDESGFQAQGAMNVWGAHRGLWGPLNARARSFRINSTLKSCPCSRGFQGKRRP